MEGPPGPETVVDGVKYLYFGGTSYLGLAAHPEVVEAGCAALRRFGVHTATTRARFGTNPPVQEVERRASEFFGAEDAFYFGSGYVANHILVRAIASECDGVLVDESAHYCVAEAARLAGLPVIPFHPRDPEDLARKAEGRRRPLVMADAVGPATGELAPVDDYLRVLERCPEACLMLDDAHGFGVLGPRGRGLLDELGLWPRVNRADAAGATRLAVCGTLAKALGGFGGIIPGSNEFVAAVRRASHYFDGASAPASAEAGATAKALEILIHDSSHRDRLRQNASWLRAALRDLGLSVPAGAAAVIGVGAGDATNMRRLHEALKARGILVPYVGSYSGIPPEGVLRIAVFANHTSDQLARLVAELRSLL